jgi:hypothetical protein
VQFQGACHRFGESVEGNVQIGLLFGACSKPAVNRAVGIEEERAEGEVKIELEQVQVKGIGLDQPDADKLLHQLPDFVIVTGNLLVNAFAGHSWDASQDDQEGFARLPGFGDALGKIVVGPQTRVGVFGAIMAHHVIARFGGVKRAGSQQTKSEGEREDVEASGLLHGGWCG